MINQISLDVTTMTSPGRGDSIEDLRVNPSEVSEINLYPKIGIPFGMLLCSLALILSYFKQLGKIVRVIVRKKKNTVIIL